MVLDRERCPQGVSDVVNEPSERRDVAVAVGEVRVTLQVVAVA